MAETSEIAGPYCTHLRVKYVRMVNNVPGEPVTYWDRWMCVDCDEDFAPKEAIASAARREERARTVRLIRGERNMRKEAERRAVDAFNRTKDKNYLDLANCEREARLTLEAMAERIESEAT